MAERERVCSRCGGSYSADVIFCPKDGTPLGARKTEVSEDPYLGLKVAGQFEIQQLIGIGAMGRVYRAHQGGIDRDVAMKILHRDLLRNKTVIARFHREAKVASRLVHPNVVQVLMTGELEPSAPDVGGEAYLVMEFLDGISLRSALGATGGTLPLPRALHIMLQVADAVGEAHSQGVVHRDLKPENVMLVRRSDDPDFVKVLDFGVARLEWSDNSVATQTGVIFGTARYISPEGARGAKVGAPGDVYSLATILFQCLSGETPFDGENPVSILLKHTTEAPPDVRSRTRSSYVPEPIARVITANLAKEPADRCRDGREFGRALIEAARASGLHPDDLIVRSSLLASGSAMNVASMERTRQLNLSNETAERLARGGPAVPVSKTEISEPELVPAPAAVSANVTRIVAPAPSSTQVLESEIKSAPRNSTALLEPASTGAPSRTAERKSTVEPTLADEPADALFGRVSSPAPLPVQPKPLSSAPRQPPHPSDSIPDGDWTPGRADNSRLRALVIATCFAIGVGLTLIVAARLGAFAKPTSEVQSYVARARAALAARAYVAPPGENVKDITDAALRRWPGTQALIDVRKDAARQVLSEAQRSKAGDRALALRLTELALELDPANEPARALRGGLAAPASSVATSSPIPAPPPPEPRLVHPAPRAARGKPPARPAEMPKPTSESSPPPQPAPAPEPVPTPPPGGRWL